MLYRKPHLHNRSLSLFENKETEVWTVRKWAEGPRLMKNSGGRDTCARLRELRLPGKEPCEKGDQQDSVPGT